MVVVVVAILQIPQLAAQPLVVDHRFYAQFALGYGFASGFNKSQRLDYPHGSGESVLYQHSRTRHQNSWELAIEIGRQFLFTQTQQLIWNLGVIAGLPTTHYQLIGRVIRAELGDPIFLRPSTAVEQEGVTVYPYHYSINSGHIMLENKIKWLSSKATSYLIPYLSFAVGLAKHRLSHYIEENNQQLNRARPLPFQSRTVNNFAYQLGIGAEWILSKNSSLDVGYRYIHLGSLAFHPRPAAEPVDIDHYRLTAGKSRRSVILFAYRYYF